VSPEKEAEIAKNLRKYSKKYEAEDEVAGAALSQAEVERRMAVMEQWRASRRQLAARRGGGAAAARGALQGGRG